LSKKLASKIKGKLNVRDIIANASNPDKKVKNIIEETNRIHHRLDEDMSNGALNLMVMAIYLEPIMSDWPSPDDRFEQRGEIFAGMYSQLYACALALTVDEDELVPTEFFDVPNGPSENILEAMSSVDGGEELISQALNLFIESAGAYADQRKASTIAQMLNMGYSEREIADMNIDAAFCKEFVNEMRQELMVTLTELHDALQSPETAEMLTDKQLALYAKHKKWFSADDMATGDPMPNDNATPYLLHLVKIAMIIHNAFSWNPVDTVKNVIVMLSHMHGIMMSGSASDVKMLLTKSSNLVISGAPISKMITKLLTHENYFTFPIDDANTALLLSNSLLTPGRLMTINSTLLGMAGPSTILNLPVKVATKHLVELYKKEQRIQELYKSTKFVKKTSEKQSKAISLAWLYAIGRHNTAICYTGRNDMAFPTLASKLKDGSELNPSLKPREWSVRSKSDLEERARHENSAEMGKCIHKMETRIKQWYGPGQLMVYKTAEPAIKPEDTESSTEESDTEPPAMKKISSDAKKEALKLIKESARAAKEEIEEEMEAVKSVADAKGTKIGSLEPARVTPSKIKRKKSATKRTTPEKDLTNAVLGIGNLGAVNRASLDVIKKMVERVEVAESSDEESKTGKDLESKGQAESDDVDSDASADDLPDAEPVSGGEDGSD
jgi:hypothetical protein